MRKNVLFVSLFAVCMNLYPQLQNNGVISIKENTEFSIYENLYVHQNAEIVNNGEMYLFKNFSNNGNINFNDSQISSVFYLVGDEQQKINGSGTSIFYDVEFNNLKGNHAFTLEKELNIYGTTFFVNGIVHESEEGILTYHQDASYRYLKDASYVNNKVNKIGDAAFTFPVGDFKEEEFVVRSASISAPDSIDDKFFVSFNWENSEVNFSSNQKEESIGLIDMNEYWEIKSNNTASSVAITLTWNEVTTPDFILSNVDNMIIVRWNGEKWVDEGGVVNSLNNEITSLVSEYGVFSLAIKNTLVTDSNVDFDSSDSFSPNNDGVNDFFVIPKLAEFYPNFKMKIYNRYGNIVYDYSNKGSLNPKWWDGKSYGRLTISSNDDLMPAATYWYIVDFNDGKTKPYQSWVYLNK
ncbi:gliding motility-associated C-terminal domain-containing protein [Tenacibaculum sp. IB213877]|uniref:gliding motility-associated C-terminal domain-containing protein n=1 Tax=Tenacibaculum sp. IB213877 TaxID=3097351 RepID=UPI002A5B07DD|nr:gliding motility-associated C-terminal domain-containing protein [Tenacibaculum sp. IB213877]MDY0781516.1 gliding motility-associated C-terminal domain-containing protein [Tenacibaculum sp. IB213877]